MAVVALKSTAITAIDAKTLVNSSLVDGTQRQFVGTASIANGDSIGSTYRIGQFPSNCRVDRITISSPDIGTTAITDIGLYQTSENGGAVVDADFFASAVSLKDGALSVVDVTHESAVYTLANSEKMLWEALGLSTDPKIMYDLVLTLTAASDAAGVAVLKAYFVM